MLKYKKSFEELVKENKQELLRDKKQSIKSKGA
ncbi:FbpB family small basic protein [Priestia megaterium]|nr:FbpB family small basic protein [Priestia megaterium]MDH3174614.1 FbpB family small basic protein [Priestia megaterium]